LALLADSKDGTPELLPAARYVVPTCRATGAPVSKGRVYVNVAALAIFAFTLGVAAAAER
jgi:hypothetical protein